MKEMFSRALKGFPSATSVKAPLGVRSYRPETARFFARDPRGGITSSNVHVKMGDPEEAYVMVPPNVGRAFKNHIFSAAGGSDATMVQLTFFHDAQLFTHDSLSSMPQLRIPRNLPRLSGLNSSPATLYVHGRMHIIALDGAEDAEYTETQSVSAQDVRLDLSILKEL